MVRDAQPGELPEILNLYLHLHETAVPEDSEHLRAVWQQIQADPNHHLIVNVQGNRIVSSCVCVIIPNLTRGIRPYAFVENVVTAPDCRDRGYASECLDYARRLTRRENCYKIMLLTGAKDEKTLNFYRHCGYNSADKTAFIQWLEQEPESSM